jgi:hypothetical protein
MHHLQVKLIDAAHAAAVKLFVPTEFGDDSDYREEPIYQRKAAVRSYAKEVGLPTAAFFPGLWMEWILTNVFDLPAMKITINGEGDALISTTSMNDVAHFTAYALTTLPRERLENAKFAFQGDLIVRAVLCILLAGVYTYFIIDLQLDHRFHSGAGIKAHRDHAYPTYNVPGPAQGRCK